MIVEFYDQRSRVLNALIKFKQLCEKEDRNFKVEVDEVFAEADKDVSR